MKSATCIGCACDDDHPCITERGDGEWGCHWVRLDRAAGLGVCSMCPGSDVSRWDTGDRNVRTAAGKAAMELVDKIKPLFAGKGPDIQGAALVELTSLWLAGHPKPLREQLLEIQVVAIRELTEVNAKILRDEGKK